MPSGTRSKEDTWNTKELQAAMAERKRSGKDSRKRHKDEDEKKERRSRESEEPRRHHRDRSDRHREDGERRLERGEEPPQQDKGSESRRRDEKRRSKHESEDEEEARQKRREERKRNKELEDGRRAKDSSGEGGHRRHRDDNDPPRRHRDDNDPPRRHRDEKDSSRRHRDENDPPRRHHRARDEDPGGDAEKRHHRRKDEKDDEKRHRSHRRGDERKTGAERRHHRREDDEKDVDSEKPKHRSKDVRQASDKKAITEKENGRSASKKEEEKVSLAGESKKALNGFEQKTKAVSKKVKKGTQHKSSDEGETEYNYDDEEFEDYDDDFEEDDDEEDEDDNDEEGKSAGKKEEARQELDVIFEAMNEENDRLMKDSKDLISAASRGERGRRDGGVVRGSSHTFIDFASTSRQPGAAGRRRAASHANRLRHIIELDTASYHLLDLPPIGEYEHYMSAFGASNCKQVYVQTNEENVDRDVQTETLEMVNVWCQHPQDETVGCGGEEDSAKKMEEFDRKPIDSVHMNMFLQKAGQVIAILLEEEIGEKYTSKEEQKSTLSISETFTLLRTPTFLCGRHVTFSHFSPEQTNCLLTIYSPTQKASSDGLSSQGVICVWNVSEPSQPQHILVCESQPRCCCFSPKKAKLVFAGMQDGSVALWDLREPFSNHRSYTEAGDHWLIRYPTYCTAGVLHADNHQSAIVSILPVVAQQDSENTKDGIYQIASLEETPIVHLWVVAELPAADQAGSESDLGLSPGGRVKLVKSSIVTFESPTKDVRLRTTLQASQLGLLPANNSHLYVTTNTGCILHRVRYGGSDPPTAYRPESEDFLSLTCLDFSPFSKDVFLVGCKGGSLRLYHIASEYPLVTWQNATQDQTDVVHVKWCRSRPSVFFVVDSAPCLSIWDLQLNLTGPVKSEPFAKSQVTGFDLSNDYRATGQGIAGRRPQMVVSLRTGEVQLHAISEEFSSYAPQELDRFTAALGHLA